MRIPDDLFVIGTMNLFDQSVEQIDFALRRRFLWMSRPFDAEALMGAAESRKHKFGLDWSRVEVDFRKLAGAATALNRKFMTARCLALNTVSDIPTCWMWCFFCGTFSAPYSRASTTTCGTRAAMPLSRSFRSGVVLSNTVLCWNNIWRDSTFTPATLSWSACPRFCSSQLGTCAAYPPVIAVPLNRSQNR